MMHPDRGCQDISVRMMRENTERPAMPKLKNITDLTNIGPTIAKRLAEVGITTRADLKRIGPVEAHRRIQAAYPTQTIPVCYYLYSLEAALRGIHWNDLPQKTKDELRAELENE